MTIFGDIKTELSIMNRTTTQKIKRETEDLNNTVHKPVLTDIYETLHLKTAEYTFFPSAHQTFSRIHHSLSHKISYSKRKSIEII